MIESELSDGRIAAVRSPVPFEVVPVKMLPALLLLGTGLTRLLRRYQLQTEVIAGLIMIGMGVSLITEAWTAIG